MMRTPVRRPSPQIAALCAMSVAALGAAGCGGEPVAQVQLLQMSPAPPVATKGTRAPAGEGVRVRASLVDPATEAQPPPLQIPQVGSIAIGRPNRGRLINALQLPATGADWIAVSPPERRWTTDRMLALVVAVLRDYRLAHPDAPPALVGDLSAAYGGPLGGHVSHQNGVDADIYYPRRDRVAAPPDRVADVDRVLAQDLVSRFVGAGAQFAFVGLRVGLGGPPGVVQAIPHHNDHVHVRIANWRR